MNDGETIDGDFEQVKMCFRLGPGMRSTFVWREQCHGNCINCFEGGPNGYLCRSCLGTREGEDWDVRYATFQVSFRRIDTGVLEEIRLDPREVANIAGARMLWDHSGAIQENEQDPQRYDRMRIDMSHATFYLRLVQARGDVDGIPREDRHALLGHNDAGAFAISDRAWLAVCQDWWRWRYLGEGYPDDLLPEFEERYGVHVRPGRRFP